MGYAFYMPPVRTFDIESPVQAGQTLHLRPPLLETVRRMDSFDGLDEAVVLACDILSRNNEDVTITAAELRTSWDYDQLRAFIGGFRGWLVSTRENDPN